MKSFQDYFKRAFGGLSLCSLAKTLRPAFEQLQAQFPNSAKHLNWSCSCLGKRMAKLESMRERLTAGLTTEHLQERTLQGWRLAAVVWEREVPGDALKQEPIPYGATIAPDGTHLEDMPPEREVLVTMLEMIVADKPLSFIAEELNRRGFRNRQNNLWTPGAVFDLLPRLIDVGPRLVKSPDWPERRARITAQRL